MPPTSCFRLVVVVVYRPSVVIAPFVEYLYCYEGIHLHSRETVLPSGRSQVIVPLDGRDGIFLGVSTRPVTVDPTQVRSVVGALLKPAGVFAVFGIGAHELRDRAVALGDICPTDARCLVDRLGGYQARLAPASELDAWIAARCPPVDDAVRQVTQVASRLSEGCSVAEAIERAGASRSSIIRRFATHVGITPKTYARLARFQRVVGELSVGSADLAQLAVRAGYFDQAHLSHEFRRFAGRPPGAYRPRSADEPNHMVD